ncbi:hypothetical protein Pmani_017853 [Petrolisthes manimaculis]|uniref:C2H2-type domain-containing protein n=1 Tax=Petrolisthes manimaculis TaxID=1843537 RepID=A0AAE1PM54_9EUCA|nr:hypothetical protein Pmani_017853 [Petrolisthes manimaculis]
MEREGNCEWTDDERRINIGGTGDWPGFTPSSNKVVVRETNCDDEWTGGRQGDGRDWHGLLTSPTGKVHHCPQCSYSTTFIHNLKRHILRHTGEKPFTCPKCSYTTSRKDLLKEHITTHDIDMPFICPYCPYSTSHHYILQRHVEREAKYLWTEGSRAEEGQVITCNSKLRKLCRVSENTVTQAALTLIELDLSPED